MNTRNPHRPEDSTEIVFIGAGVIANAIAGHLVSAGHPVTLANRCGPESLRDRVTALRLPNATLLVNTRPAFSSDPESLDRNRSVCRRD